MEGRGGGEAQGVADPRKLGLDQPDMDFCFMPGAAWPLTKAGVIKIAESRFNVDIQITDRRNVVNCNVVLMSSKWLEMSTSSDSSRRGQVPLQGLGDSKPKLVQGRVNL
jgi:hypothetical protein